MPLLKTAVDQVILQQPQGPGGIILQKEVPAIVNTRKRLLSGIGQTAAGKLKQADTIEELARLAALHACTGSIYET